MEEVGPGVLVIGAITKEEFTLHLLFSEQLCRGGKKGKTENQVSVVSTQLQLKIPLNFINLFFLFFVTKINVFFKDYNTL